jgi:hypothetical protein
MATGVPGISVRGFSSTVVPGITAPLRGYGVATRALGGDVTRNRFSLSFSVLGDGEDIGDDVSDSVLISSELEAIGELMAFVIDSMFRGSDGSVISPSLFTNSTVGTALTLFFSDSGVSWYVLASILIMLALRPFVAHSSSQRGM